MAIVIAIARRAFHAAPAIRYISYELRISMQRLPFGGWVYFAPHSNEGKARHAEEEHSHCHFCGVCRIRSSLPAFAGDLNNALGGALGGAAGAAVGGAVGGSTGSIIGGAVGGGAGGAVTANRRERTGAIVGGALGGGTGAAAGNAMGGRTGGIIGAAAGGGSRLGARRPHLPLELVLQRLPCSQNRLAPSPAPSSRLIDRTLTIGATPR